MSESSLKKEYVVTAEIKPVLVIGHTYKSVDENVARDLIIKMLKEENIPPHLVTTRAYLKKLIRKDPLMKIVMRLTGKKLNEIDEECEDKEPPVTIFNSSLQDFARRALIIYFLTIEHVVLLFGKHPKFVDMLKLIEDHMNNFFDKYAFYKTRISIDKISDDPIVKITMTIEKGE